MSGPGGVPGPGGCLVRRGWVSGPGGGGVSGPGGGGVPGPGGSASVPCGIPPPPSPP